MNRTQKGAWYGVLLSFLLAGIVVFDFLDTRVRWPMILLVGTLWGGLLLGPVYLLGRKRQPSAADTDERDRQIIRKALLASFALLAVMPGVAFVAALFVLDFRSTIAITMNQLSAVVYSAVPARGVIDSER